jgi:hypothetical protein
MSYEQTAVAEQQFWLQILGDHARFIYYALAENEKTEIEQSTSYLKATTCWTGRH